MGSTCNIVQPSLADRILVERRHESHVVIIYTLPRTWAYVPKLTSRQQSEEAIDKRREEVLTSSIQSSPSNIKSAAIQCILRSTSQRRAIECSLNLIQLDHVTLILQRRQGFTNLLFTRSTMILMLERCEEFQKTNKLEV